MTNSEKYADKIAKLLAKAQSTTPEEAELLYEKAQELMTRYAIDEAMIDAARGVSNQRDEIVEHRWEYTGTYRQAAWRLGNVVAKQNNCTTLLSDDTYQRKAFLYVIGFRSDVERARALETSLQLQMARALNAWYKENGQDWWDRNRKFAERRQFMFSFSQGVGEKLRVVVAKATKAAAEDHGTGMELVLRNRKDQVKDWVDNQYGTLRAGSSRSYKGGSSSAISGGFAAGQRADTGQPGVGRSTKALNS